EADAGFRLDLDRLVGLAVEAEAALAAVEDREEAPGFGALAADHVEDHEVRAAVAIEVGSVDAPDLAGDGELVDREAHVVPGLRGGREGGGEAGGDEEREDLAARDRERRDRPGGERVGGRDRDA